MYTIHEKIHLYNWYCSGSSLRQVRALFSVEYPDRPIPSISTISRIVKKFQETGCIHNDHHPVRRGPYKVDENKQIDIVAAVVNNKRMTSRLFATENGVSQCSVLKVLHKEKFKSFKFQNHQELVNNDPERRTDFCELMFNSINENDDLLSRICFTDEATFTIHGEVNSQNCRYWSRENEHLFNSTRTQRPQKVNVWAGLIRDQVIGPFFLDGNLDGREYLNLLRDRIIPSLLNTQINNIWYQQDGAPPHNTAAVTEYLHQTFQENWIGNRGPVRWPARSPDLTPLDFYYWPYMRQKVYNAIPIVDVEDLKNRITAVSESIPPIHIENAIRSFYDRLSYCQVVNGGIFENSI